MLADAPANSSSSAKRTLFASDRERRLWKWTACLVAGIYATLGIASTLAEFLYNQGLSAILFLTCMLMVGLTILMQGLRARPRGIEIGVLLGIAVVYFMVLFRLAIPERSHLIEYSVVAVFIFEALQERRSHGRKVPLPAVLTIIVTTLVGAVDEYIQLVLPSRTFEWTDMLFNFLAALMATLSMVMLGAARRLAGSLMGDGEES